MPITLKTLVHPWRFGVPQRADAPLHGVIADAQVFNGRLFVLVHGKSSFETDLHVVDLLSGERELLYSDVPADALLGVLGGVPVVFSDVHGLTEAWLVTQPEHRVQLVVQSQWLQTNDAIVCSYDRTVDGRETALCMHLVNGRLALRRVDWELIVCARDHALTVRRLPPWCQSLHIRLAPTAAADEPTDTQTIRPLVDGDVHGKVLYASGWACVDGQTGAVVWQRSNFLHVLLGDWSPSRHWSPETHALYAPDERARALALVLLLGACLPRRLALGVVGHLVDA